MARKKNETKEEVAKGSEEHSVYASTTPIWDKYYQEMRKRVKFPRYYKKALNW